MPARLPSPLMAHAVLLTPPKSFHLKLLFPRQHFASISPLAATLMDLLASVANKRLTAELNPLDATLTKNEGWGYSSQFGKVCALTATRTRISFKFFLFTLLRTLLHGEKYYPLSYQVLLHSLRKTTGGGVPFQLSSRLASSGNEGQPDPSRSLPHYFLTGFFVPSLL